MCEQWALVVVVVDCYDHVTIITFIKISLRWRKQIEVKLMSHRTNDRRNRCQYYYAVPVTYGWTWTHRIASSQHLYRYLALTLFDARKSENGSEQSYKLMVFLVLPTKNLFLYIFTEKVFLLLCMYAKAFCDGEPVIW